MFWKVFFIGVVLVFIQGLFAFLDGYLTQKQMRIHGLTGYSFMEHGGMLADIILITPIVAYLISTYNFTYFSLRGLVIGVLVLGFVLFSLSQYTKTGISEAHQHNGRTTIAGWIHALYAAISLWYLISFYFSKLTPQISHRDLLAMAVILTIFFPLVVIKFSDNWSFHRNFPTVQICIECIMVWGVTGLKFRFPNFI